MAKKKITIAKIANTRIAAAPPSPTDVASCAVAYGIAISANIAANVLTASVRVMIRRQ